MQQHSDTSQKTVITVAVLLKLQSLHNEFSVNLKAETVVSECVNNSNTWSRTGSWNM
jgi:hypothetical protein